MIMHEPREGLADDRVKDFFNFLLLVKVLHVLGFHTLENSVGNTAHDILSLVSKCKMDGGETKFVNFAYFRGSWAICETFDVEDICIAKASGLLLPLGGAFRVILRVDAQKGWLTRHDRKDRALYGT